MLDIRRLVWTEWNVAHIARHNVIPEEVEEICQANSQTEGAKKGRLRITGRTKQGRIISAFLDAEPEEGVYFPVTARDANKNERSDYQAWSKGGEKAA